MNSVFEEEPNLSVSGGKVAAAFELCQGCAPDGEGAVTLAQIFRGWGHPDCASSFAGASAAGSDVELELWNFQGAMHVLLTQYLGSSKDQLELALVAYDAGLANGFYGSGSAISRGLAIRYESMIQSAEDKAGFQMNWDLLSRIHVSARWHARIFRNGSGRDGRVPGVSLAGVGYGLVN